MQCIEINNIVTTHIYIYIDDLSVAMTIVSSISSQPGLAVWQRAFEDRPSVRYGSVRYSLFY